jgi:hypothetical protein
VRIVNIVENNVKHTSLFFASVINLFDKKIIAFLFRFQQVRLINWKAILWKFLKGVGKNKNFRCVN